MACILIIDDEETNRDLLNDILINEGHEIVQAENGRLGIEAYERYHPQLVITDIMMPEIDGLGVIEHIRKQTTDAFIIAVAAAGDLVLQQALTAGANNVLEKPFHIRHLVETVRTAIATC